MTFDNEVLMSLFYIFLIFNTHALQYTSSCLMWLKTIDNRANQNGKIFHMHQPNIHIFELLDGCNPLITYLKLHALSNRSSVDQSIIF